MPSGDDAPASSNARGSEGLTQGRVGPCLRSSTALDAGLHRDGCRFEGHGLAQSERPRRSWALAATTIVETLVAMAPTAIGRSKAIGREYRLPQGSR